MSQQSDYLENHGWVRASAKRRGMVVVVKWRHPMVAGAPLVQQDAYLLERARQKNKPKKEDDDVTFALNLIRQWTTGVSADQESDLKQAIRILESKMRSNQTIIDDLSAKTKKEAK